MKNTEGQYATKTWYGRAGEGRDVWQAALDRTRHIFREFDHVLVQFSGGKDSTATLHVALEVAAEFDRLPLRVVHFDEECISMETEHYVRRVAERPDVDLEWYCLPVRHRNACSIDSPTWWPWAPEDRERWARPLPPEAITELDGFTLWPADERPSIPDCSPLLAPRDRFGRTCALLGIRAQESMVRRRAVSNHRRENWVIPTGVAHYYKAYPVYDWSTADIWTAPAQLGWDYNETYDLMEMAGIPHFGQRCAPPFGEEPMQLLWMWAQCFPDLWERMCERVPGAAAAARYSRTELYAFKERPEKPDGVSWPEWIRQLIDQHDAEVRPWLARHVQRAIRRHHRKTHEPIMPTAKHPDSGLCWEWLAMVALRGDFKERRQMMEMGGVGTDEGRRRARAAYDRERAAVEGGSDGSS